MLVNVVMAISAADLFTSLIQFIATVVTAIELNIEMEEVEGDAYKVVNNLTNNTL